MRGLAALACGSIAWVALSLSVVLLPALLQDLRLSTAAHLSVVLVLVCSALVQIGAAPLARFAPWLGGTELLAIGFATIASALLFSLEWCAVVGIAVTGGGIGIAYRTALVHLTQGAAPAKQAALASLYGAVTYGAAAMFILLSGVLAQALTLLATVIALMTALGIGALGLSFIAPRVGEAGSATASAAPLAVSSEP